MNKPILLSPAPLNEAQLACIDLLTEALEQARGGHISAVGIIACLKDGYAASMAGTQASALNLAADDLKAQILERVRRGDKPSILRTR